MDWHRKKKREAQHIEYPGELPEAEAPTPSPQEALEEKQDIEALQAQIKSLPPRYQRVIELRCEGKSYRQIAEIMGFRVETVKKRIQRAVKEMKNN